MIDLELELRELYADTSDDHAAAERIRAAVATPRSRRSSVWTVGAAITAAACIAIATVALRSTDSRISAAGGARASCTAPLPAGWQRALDTAPIAVDGVPAYPIGLTVTGDAIVAWQPGGGPPRLGITAADGSTRTLIPALGEHLGGGYALEGDTLVVGPTRWGHTMAVIDVRTGDTREISLGPAMPAGYLASDGVAMLDGIVYFGASPRHDGIGGVIVAYDLAEGSSHIIARTDGPVFVRQDARGVLWHNGGIRAGTTPAAVPGANAVFEVDGDGADYAWNVDQQTSHEITWSDGSGPTRSFTVDLPDHPDAAPIVMAVSGPYVLLSPYSDKPFPDAHEQLAVLDTRTGAVAELGIPMVDDSAAGLPSMLAFTNGDDATLRIDTAKLPGLGC